MKTKWKNSARRLLALVLCLSMILPVLPQAVWAEEITEGTDSAVSAVADDTSTASETGYYCGLSEHEHGSGCLDTDKTYKCNIPAHTHDATQCGASTVTNSLASISDAATQTMVKNVIKKIGLLPDVDAVRTYCNTASNWTNNAEGKLPYQQKLYGLFYEVNQYYLSWTDPGYTGTKYQNYLTQTQKTTIENWQKLFTVYGDGTNAGIGHFDLPHAAENTRIYLFDYGPQINIKITGKSQGFLPFYQLYPLYGRTVDGEPKDDSRTNTSTTIYPKPLDAYDNGGTVKGTYTNGTWWTKTVPEEYVDTKKPNFDDKTLDVNGFPIVSLPQEPTWIQRGQLRYLFDPTFTGTSESKFVNSATWQTGMKNATSDFRYNGYQFARAYLPVNHDGTGTGLFQKDEKGYLYYDSGKNAAWYNPEKEKFELYNYTLTPGHTAYDNYGGTSNGNFLPFNKGHEGQGILDYTTRTSSVFSGGTVYTNATSATVGDKVDGYQLLRENYRLQTTDRTNAVNLNFGMVVEFDFYMPTDGKVNNENMTFTFKGDDDVWVFIEDKLVLDMGGQGGKEGTIDFATGAVTYSNYGLTGTETEANGKPKVRTDTLRNILGLNTKTLTEYKTYTLKFFYLERGGNVSNCRMIFNMPSVQKKTLQVTKELNATETLGNPDYYFTARTSSGLFVGPGSTSGVSTYKVKNSDGSYELDADGKPVVQSVSTNGVFTLKAGQTAVFEGITESLGDYYVYELFKSADKAQYGSTVTVNGTSTNIGSFTTVSGFSYAAKSGKLNAKTAVQVTFQNTPSNLGTLKIKKTVSGYQTGQSYKIYVTLDGEPLPSGTKYTISGSEKTIGIDTTGSYVSLKHNETAVISNILSGTQFKVKEPAVANHTTKCKVVGGEDSSPTTDTATTEATGTIRYSNSTTVNASNTNIATVTVTNTHTTVTYKVGFYLVDPDTGKPINSSGSIKAFSDCTTFNTTTAGNEGKTFKTITMSEASSTATASTILSQCESLKDQYALYDTNAYSTVTPTTGDATKYTITNTTTKKVGDAGNGTTYVVTNNTKNTGTAENEKSVTLSGATIFFAVYKKGTLQFKYTYYLVNEAGQPIDEFGNTSKDGKALTFENAYQLGEPQTYTLYNATATATYVTLKPSTKFAAYREANGIDSGLYSYLDSSAYAYIGPDYSTSQDHTAWLAKSAVDGDSIAGTYIKYQSAASTYKTIDTRALDTNDKVVKTTIGTDSYLANTTVYFAVYQTTKPQINYSYYLVDSEGNPMQADGKTDGVTFDTAHKLDFTDTKTIDGTNPITLSPVASDVSGSGYSIYNPDGAEASVKANYSTAQNSTVTLAPDNSYIYIKTSSTANGENDGPITVATGDLKNATVYFPVTVTELPTYEYRYYLLSDNNKPMDKNGVEKDYPNQVDPVAQSGSLNLTAETTLTAGETTVKPDTTLYTVQTGSAKLTPDFAANEGHGIVLSGTYTYAKVGTDAPATGVTTFNTDQHVVVYLAVKPKLAPKIKYTYYLVNSNGKPINQYGQTTWDHDDNDATDKVAYTFQTAHELGTAKIQSLTKTTTLHPSTNFSTYCGTTIESSLYGYYKNDTTTTTDSAYVKVTPDFTNSSNQKVKLNLKGATGRTYIEYADGTFVEVTTTQTIDLTKMEGATIYFAVVPKFDLSIKYIYYLVNENGEPIDQYGNTAKNGTDYTYKTAYKLRDNATALNYTVSAYTNIKAGTKWSTYCDKDIDSSLYSYSTTYPYVRVTPNFSSSQDHKIRVVYCDVAAYSTWPTYVEYGNTVIGTGDADDNSVSITASQMKSATIYFPVKVNTDLTIKYSFYLVNPDGQPISSADATGTTNWEGADKFDKTAVPVELSYTAKTLKVDDYFASYFGSDASKYEIYDADATATFTLDYSTSQNHSYALSNTSTTHVKNSANTPEIKLDGTSEISFAVRMKPKAVEDIVVIDFGLPVDINVVENDKYFASTPVVTGISGNTTYGTKARNGNVVTYTPGSMKMENADSFTYTVKETWKKTDRYFEGTVTIIPATAIYYEDDLKDAGNNTVITYQKLSMSTHQTAGSWVTVKDSTFGDSTSRKQSADRPGVDGNSIYGTDQAYNGTDSKQNCLTMYSMGQAHKVTVDANAYGTAKFTFTGTGFDVISMTNSNTGVITVAVHQGTSTEGKRVFYKMVDTYYGYTLNKDGEWVANPGTGGIYQVPVMKVDLNQVLDDKGNPYGYGEYTVEITASYLSFMDHNTKDASYDFYLDAIRIYDPADGGANNTKIQGAYQNDHEYLPAYEEVRDLLLTADDLTGEGKATGVVFIDGKGGMNVVADYKNYGPKNEVYLGQSQSIAFALDAADADQVHIGLKSVDTNGAEVVVREANASGTTITLNSTTDQYYDITGLKTKTVVITNTGTKTVSITNIKFTHAEPTPAVMAMRYFALPNVEEVIADLNQRMGYEDGEVDTEINGGIDMQYATVTLEDEVHVNFYYNLTGDLLTLLDQNQDAGLLLWNSDPGEDPGYYDAQTIAKGFMVYDADKGLYVSSTTGIPAKQLGDDLYARVYVKTGDDTYAYGNVVQYSPKKYAYNLLKNSKSDSMKDLSAAMLNYGAAAQAHFGYNTENMVNADLERTIAAYDSTMCGTRSDVTNVSLNGYTVGSEYKHFASVSFEGALAINYYVNLPSNVVEVQLYYWDAAAYQEAVNGNVLDVETATGSVELEAVNGTFEGQISGIAAKQLNDEYVMCAVYTTDEGTFSTNVVSYSVGTYCKATAESSNVTMAELAKATAVYGYYAKEHFGN